MTEPHLQPLLHELVVAVDAPALMVSGHDGQIRPTGAHGVYVSDLRVVSQLVVTVDGREPEPILAEVAGAGGARFVGVLRWLGDPTPDPTVRLERHRVVSETACTEDITVHNASRRRVECELALALAADLADLRDVKAGRAPRTPMSHAVDVVATPHPDAAADSALSWRLDIAPGAVASISVRLLIARPTDRRRVTAGWAGRAPWRAPVVRCSDDRLTRLVARSLADLDGLLLADPDVDGDCFLAAGAPWFLTLFGRDSLWAARMLLPLQTAVARGTLHTLARRQGRRVDPTTGEQPGKILHEVRRDHPAGRHLPPIYYGTIDATPLWVMLLHDAWRWGMPAADVEALLPAAEAALGWLRDYGDSDGDGFLEYVDESGRGLANQGWKDSHDSVQFADGTLARPPIALCEVQGYAYEAAMAGAALLDAFNRPGSDGWRAWANALRARFRDAFWVDHPDGPYPAVALDGEKRQVDVVASNMGHLLGTGLLDHAEVDLVARRLAAPALDSGFGLRTMAADSPRYNPLGYHTGSVWPHDTAVAVAGLARTGHGEVAAALANGLLAAAPTFDYQLPELYGGDGRNAGAVPLAYPAACRPQAWAASSVIAVIAGLIGLDPDVPNGCLGVRPTAPFPFARLDVSGLMVDGGPLDLRVTDGHVEVLTVSPKLTVVR